MIEVKFSADLTSNQPNNYLNWLLADDSESVLVFLVPESRIKWLWPELKGRVGKMGQELSDVEAERRCMRVGDTLCHLMLVSWRTLLDGMAVRTKAAGEAPVIEENIRQLSGLARSKSEEVVQPFSVRYLELGPDIEERRERDLKDIVDRAIEIGDRTGWASRVGLRQSRPSSLYPYGRYFTLSETPLEREVWLGVDNDRWKESGTPLWLRFNPRDLGVLSSIQDRLPEGSDEGWSPVTLTPDAEIDRVVDDVASQLKGVSDIIKCADC